MRNYDPLIAVAVVAVMQLIALAFVFGWYHVRDRYAHDCDHGDHSLVPIGAQSQSDLGAPITGKRLTVVLYRCRYCTHVESVTLVGSWSIDQVRAWGFGIIPDPNGWTPDTASAGADEGDGEPATAPVPALPRGRTS